MNILLHLSPYFCAISVMASGSWVILPAHIFSHSLLLDIQVISGFSITDAFANTQDYLP